MHKRKITGTDKPRLSPMQPAAEYCSMGRTTFRKWAEEIGALRRFGRILRVDMDVVNAALDAMGSNNTNDPGEKIDMCGGSGGMN